MIILVRHGETGWNVERRMQGRLDSPLTARGQRQARAVAGLVRDLIGREAGAWRRGAPARRGPAPRPAARGGPGGGAVAGLVRALFGREAGPWRLVASPTGRAHATAN